MQKFEEYKLFVESTDRFADRRQQISNTYLTVNSIIVGAVSFLIKDVGIVASWRFGIVVMVLIIGTIVCLVWKQIIGKYKVLVSFRIDELRKIEQHPSMKDCQMMYHAEDKLYPRDEEGKSIKGQALNISDKEKWLPNIFMLSYLSFAIGLIIYSVISLFVR